MSNFFAQELQVLDQELDLISKQRTTIAQRCDQALLKLGRINQGFRTRVRETPFPDEAQEIAYFKIYRPHLIGLIIFYHRIYQIEITCAKGAEKTLRRQYKLETKRIEQFFETNAHFVEYIRSEQSYMDNEYFLRSNNNQRVTLLNYNYDTDHEQSTNFDMIVAELQACDRLSEFIQDRFNKAETNTPAKPQFGLKWTESKIALVEMIYALQSSGAINNGSKDIKELANCFQEVFDIDLGDYYKSYLDIKMRKTGPAKFIDNLAENLQRRIDNQDEF